MLTLCLPSFLPLFLLPFLALAATCHVKDHTHSNLNYYSSSQTLVLRTAVKLILLKYIILLISLLHVGNVCPFPLTVLIPAFSLTWLVPFSTFRSTKSYFFQAELKFCLLLALDSPAHTAFPLSLYRQRALTHVSSHLGTSFSAPRAQELFVLSFSSLLPHSHPAPAPVSLQQ